jgi:hypothetical protein
VPVKIGAPCEGGAGGRPGGAAFGAGTVSVSVPFDWFSGVGAAGADDGLGAGAGAWVGAAAGVGLSVTIGS